MWGKSLGGTLDDVPTSVIQTDDHGFVVAGISNSNDGDVTGNHGLNDSWIVKLDSSGNLVWEKSLGGSGNEEAHAILETNNGDLMIVGPTSSNDGDVSGNHGYYGSYYFDDWIVKLSADGDLLWQKCFGSDGGELANSIAQTTNGGDIIAGSASGAIDGD